MFSIIALLAVTVLSVTVNPLGTKTILESIIPTPLNSDTSGSALTYTLPTLSTHVTSSSFPAVTAVTTGEPPPNDPAAANLADAIAAAFSQSGPVFNLSASAGSEATATSLFPTSTKPLSISAVSYSVASVPSTSSPIFTVLTATVPLGSVVSTTAQFATGLSAIVPLTSYPSQEPTMPIPRLPEPPEASLSSLLNNGSMSNISAPTTGPSSISTLYLPTGIPADNITTLPTILPSAVPTTTPFIDPVALLKNVTAAIQVLEVLTTVLEGDSGEVSAVSIPNIGTSIGSNDKLTDLLRGMVVSLLS